MEEGKPHAKTYRASAVVGEEDKGKGEGPKKKVAQTLAVGVCLRAVDACFRGTIARERASPQHGTKEYSEDIAC